MSSFGSLQIWVYEVCKCILKSKHGGFLNFEWIKFSLFYVLSHLFWLLFNIMRSFPGNFYKLCLHAIYCRLTMLIFKLLTKYAQAQFLEKNALKIMRHTPLLLLSFKPVTKPSLSSPTQNSLFFVSLISSLSKKPSSDTLKNPSCSYSTSLENGEFFSISTQTMTTTGNGGLLSS